MQASVSAAFPVNEFEKLDAQHREHQRSYDKNNQLNIIIDNRLYIQRMHPDHIQKICYWYSKRYRKEKARENLQGILRAGQRIDDEAGYVNHVIRVFDKQNQSCERYTEPVHQQ